MTDSRAPETREQPEPHPLGATLGPAAIGPRRRDPLLAAEIVRLLERHGVPWNQAVREAAGLMAQTVEETEGWWAFEMADVDSPTDAEMIAAKRAAALSDPPVGKDSGFEELLYRFERTILEQEYATAGDAATSASNEYCAARAVLSRYVEQLKAENAQLRERVLTPEETASLWGYIKNKQFLNRYTPEIVAKLNVCASTQGDTAQ